MRHTFDQATTRPFARVLLLAALAASSLFLPTAPPAHAAGTLVVNTTAAGMNDDQQPLCSLAEAMQSAVATRANDDCPEVDSPSLITFTVNGPVKVNDQLPNLGDGDNVSILGPVTFDLLNAGTLPFDLDGGTLNVSLASFIKAKTTAINIATAGTVNLAGVSFDGNATQASGGAITNRGVLRIAGTNFVGNTAEGDGGAIESNGELIIAGSNFNGNSAKGRGGALYVSGGKLEITDSIFSGNVAQTESENDGGGAIFITSGNEITGLSITRSGFSGNLALQASGGALQNNTSALLTIRESSFQGNLAGNPTVTKARGGAILTRGPLAISGSSFLNNGSSGDGGALSNESGGRVTLANTSFTANAAAAKGGGLINRNPSDINTNLGETQTITAINVTFSSNVALEGGGIYNIEPQYDPIRLTNTIVDGSDVTGGNCADGDTQRPAAVSAGHNLDSGASCGFDQLSDRNGFSAKLAAPGFNGGPLVTLLTQKLNSGSAAIDTGDQAVCAAAPIGNRDQRNSQRPLDGDGDGIATCDIGAFENETASAGAGGTPLPPGPIAFGNTTVGTPIDAGFSLFETGNTTLTISAATLGGANSGDFAVLSPLPLSLPDGAPAANLALRCTPSAVGTRLASLTLNTSDPAKPTVSYNLICTGTPQPAAGFSSTPLAPGPVSFGKVLVGGEASQHIVVQENGTAALIVNSPLLGGANAGDFSVDPGLSLTIDQGAAAQQLPVKCKPTDYGIRTATLTLSTNDPTRPSVSYNLTCTGIQPLSPALEAGGQSVANTQSGSTVGPYGLAISPDGSQVYVADSGKNTLSALSRASGNGSLTLLQPEYEDEFAGGANLKGAALVTVSPDGRNVYVTAGLSSNIFVNNSDNAITAFQRDPATGALTVLDSVTQGDNYGCPLLGGPCAGTVSGLAGAYAVAVSPDNRFVYVSSMIDSAIVVLRRGSDGGLKTQFLVSNANFVAKTTHPDLKGAYGIALSPDGAFLYVASAGGTPDGLLVFKRNAADGTLSHVETKKADTTPGLNGVLRVTVSSDGNFVYAVAGSSDSVTAWQRSQIDGKLTHLATYSDGQNGVDGLDSASAVALSPDGTRLYASGYNDNAVAVFDRDPSSGLLEFHEAVKRGASGEPALRGARDLVVSPDGKTIHVTGFLDNKVVTLRVANPVPLLSSLSPASLLTGSSALSLTVSGANFVEGAKVRWNGVERPTTFVSSGELRAALNLADLASAGSAQITVANPAPGGGVSNARSFTVTAPDQNPLPSISQLAPQGAAAGDEALVVEVAGSGFLPSSKVRWNGGERATVYVSPTRLQVQIGAADLATPGEAGVVVVSPAPGGGESNAVAFSIAAPGENPLPTVQHLTPPSIIAGAEGASEVALTLSGQGFTPESQARWNDEPRPTTYLSATALLVIVSAADLGNPGTASIVVGNPAPGGGESNAVAFTIGNPGDNPVPVVGEVSYTPNGDGSVRLIIRGAGFVAGSQVFWGGTSRPTSLVGDEQLSATLTLADIIATPAVVSVANPAPGGGPSNEFVFDPPVVRLPFVRK